MINTGDTMQNAMNRPPWFRIQVFIEVPDNDTELPVLPMDPPFDAIDGMQVPVVAVIGICE